MTDYKGDKLNRLSGDERLGMHRESEYLGAEDIKPGTKPVLTIEGIYYGKVTLQRGKENKDVMTFLEKSVDGKTLKKIYGAVDADTLEGKKVELYVDHNVRDPQTGGTTDGIRISAYIPKAESYICAECGEEITPAGQLTARDIAMNTQKKYGKMLCATHWAELRDKAKAEENANENNENQN